MKIFKSGSSAIVFLGYIAGIIAFWHFSIQQKQMFSSPYPVYDRKYGAAIEALGFISCITIVIGNFLKKIEKRLERIEEELGALKKQEKSSDDVSPDA